MGAAPGEGVYTPCPQGPNCHLEDEDDAAAAAGAADEEATPLEALAACLVTGRLPRCALADCAERGGRGTR